MSDRRETPRPKTDRSSKGLNHETSWEDSGERIAKYLARAGIASRREAEAMIERGEVRVNGKQLTTPAFKVSGREDIRVKGKAVRRPQATRLWRYHKPAGLITTTNDPDGRRTIFEELPKALPRTVTVGRLDLSTEGLLLLTNDGGLARHLELPSTGLARLYRARAYGRVKQDALDTLKAGITTKDGETYAPITAMLERASGANSWITVELSEGKNREVRKALEHLDLKVNRLIRTQYGPFELGDLQPGGIEEVAPNQLARVLEDTAPGYALDHGEPPSAAGRKAVAGSRVHRRRG